MNYSIRPEEPNLLRVEVTSQVFTFFSIKTSKGFLKCPQNEYIMTVRG